MIWIVQLGKELVRALTDPYRPELHYMRGPGPKWRGQARRGLTPNHSQAIAKPQNPDRFGSWMPRSLP